MEIERLSAEPSDAPDHLICPFSYNLMADPVIDTASGLTFDRPRLDKWIEECRRTRVGTFEEDRYGRIDRSRPKWICNPMTMQPLGDLVPNRMCLHAITYWCEQNPDSQDAINFLAPQRASDAARDGNQRLERARAPFSSETMRPSTASSTTVSLSVWFPLAVSAMSVTSSDALPVVSANSLMMSSTTWFTRVFLTSMYFCTSFRNFPSQILRLRSAGTLSSQRRLQ
jgi:hypothetical protein